MAFLPKRKLNLADVPGTYDPSDPAALMRNALALTQRQPEPNPNSSMRITYDEHGNILEQRRGGALGEIVRQRGRAKRPGEILTNPNVKASRA